MSEERATTPLDVRIGRAIRARRLELGMSQETLALTLGITFQQIQKYEKGLNRVAASRLWNIADALGAPIKLFLPDPQEALPQGDGEAMAVLATPEGQDMMRLFARMSPRIRKKVVGLAETLIDAAL